MLAAISLFASTLTFFTRLMHWLRHFEITYTLKRCMTPRTNTTTPI